MSLLDVGKSCAECSTVDFLPFTCPLCSKILCRAHVQAHACIDDDESTSFASAGPSSFRRKAHCEVAKCERPSIEAVGGKEGDELGERIAKEVRCRGCGGAYCTTHRSQTAHSCTAPLEHNARHDALEARRAKAREIMAQKFPQYKDRVIPKPPPQRDVVKVRPRSDSPPRPAVPTSQPKAEPVVPAPSKTKAEKLREVEIRKMRSMAVPLDSRMRIDGERRFFQWCTGTQSDLDRWEREGKLGDGKKPDRVWVPQETPIGKVLDLMIEKSKIPRPPPDKPLELHCLYLDAEGDRRTRRLQTDRPASEIVEGGTVLLIRRR